MITDAVEISFRRDCRINSRRHVLLAYSAPLTWDSIPVLSAHLASGTPICFSNYLPFRLLDDSHSPDDVTLLEAN
jgi:hypothetical protein